MNKGYEQPQTQGTNQNLMEMSLPPSGRIVGTT